MSRMRWMAVLALTLVVAGTFVGAASAPAYADEGATLTTDLALDSVLDGPGGPGRPGHPGPGHRHPVPCVRLTALVLKACPCNGPDGAGWDSHDAFVECVATTLETAVADKDNPRLAECADRILARAEASQVGEEGFECPTRPVRRLPGRPTPTAVP